MRHTALQLLVALVACCALVASASTGARQLLQKSASASSGATSIADGGGDASATSTAASTGGVAVAEAFASTEITESAKNIFISVTNEIVDKTADDIGNCTLITSVAETAISAQAEAVAAVYVEAFGEVSVEGEGEACADAQAAGEASASAFADVTGVAVVEALGDNAEAGAEAVVQAIAAATAEAFASAFAETCTTGGFGQAQQTSFAEAIVRPMVEVYALAIGGTGCEAEAKAISESIVEADSSVQDSAVAETQSTTVAMGDTTSGTGGDAGATTDTADTIEEVNAVKAENAERCRAPLSTCCTSRFRDKDACTCSIGSRTRCDAKKISAKDAAKAVWENSDGKICTC